MGTGRLKTGGTPSGPGRPVWLGVVLLPGWRAGGSHLGCHRGWSPAREEGGFSPRKHLGPAQQPAACSAEATVDGAGNLVTWTSLRPGRGWGGVGPIATARIQAQSRLWESRRVPESR